MSDAPVIEIKHSKWETIRNICISVAAVSIPILCLLVVRVADNASDALAISQETGALAHRIEASGECRFDENSEISDINDWIDYWTAVGLRASVEEDEDQLREALDQIDHYTDLFRDLIETRSSIAERCSAIVDPVGSPPSTQE